MNVFNVVGVQWVIVLPILDFINETVGDLYAEMNWEMTSFIQDFLNELS